MDASLEPSVFQDLFGPFCLFESEEELQEELRQPRMVQEELRQPRMALI